MLIEFIILIQTKLKWSGLFDLILFSLLRLNLLNVIKFQHVVASPK